MYVCRHTAARVHVCGLTGHEDVRVVVRTVLKFDAAVRRAHLHMHTLENSADTQTELCATPTPHHPHTTTQQHTLKYPQTQHHTCASCCASMVAACRARTAKS